MRRLAPLVVGLMLVACGGSPEGTGSPSPSTNPARISSTARVEIEKPKDNSNVPADHVEVKIALTGATLSKLVTTDIKPDVGHMHLKLDGVTISILAGLDEVLNDVVDSATGKPVGTLSKGFHTLQAQFVASDHGRFQPDVFTQVNFIAV